MEVMTNPEVKRNTILHILISLIFSVLIFLWTLRQACCVFL